MSGFSRAANQIGRWTSDDSKSQLLAQLRVGQVSSQVERQNGQHTHSLQVNDFGPFNFNLSAQVRAKSPLFLSLLFLKSSTSLSAWLLHDDDDDDDDQEVGSTSGRARKQQVAAPIAARKRRVESRFRAAISFSCANCLSDVQVPIAVQQISFLCRLFNQLLLTLFLHNHHSALSLCIVRLRSAVSERMQQAVFTTNDQRRDVFIALYLTRVRIGHCQPARYTRRSLCCLQRLSADLRVWPVTILRWPPSNNNNGGGFGGNLLLWKAEILLPPPSSFNQRVDAFGHKSWKAQIKIAINFLANNSRLQPKQPCEWLRLLAKQLIRIPEPSSVSPDAAHCCRLPIAFTRVLARALPSSPPPPPLPHTQQVAVFRLICSPTSFCTALSLPGGQPGKWCSLSVGQMSKLCPRRSQQGVNVRSAGRPAGKLLPPTQHHFGQAAREARLSPAMSLFNRLEGLVFQLQGSRDFFSQWPEAICQRIRTPQPAATPTLAGPRNGTFSGSPNKAPDCWNGHDFNGYSKTLAQFGQPITSNHPEVPMIQADPINALVLNYVARLKTINAHLTVKAARAPTLLPYQSVELGARLQQNRAPYTHLQDRNHPEKLVRLPASGEQMFVDQPVVFEVGGHAALSTVATPALPIEGIPLDPEEEKDELPGDEPEGTGEVASEEEEAETGEEEDSEGAESNEEPDEGEVKCKKEDCSDLFDLAPTPNNHLSGNGLPAASIPVTPLVTGEQLQHGHIVVPSEESYEQPDLVNLKPSRPPTIFNPNKFQPGPPEIVSHNDIYGTTNKYFSNWELTTRSSSASSLHIISSNLILLHLFIGLLATSGLNNLLLNRRR